MWQKTAEIKSFILFCNLSIAIAFVPCCIYNIRNILQGEVKAKNLEFFIDTVDVVDENIICDKVRLSQIILNCTSNAVKYTKPGGTVGVRVIRKENAPE